MSEQLDGLQFAGYSIGGSVDISAAVTAATDQAIARNSDIDRSTLTVKEWARRKNANFRLAGTTIVVAAVTYGMSIPLNKYERLLGTYYSLPEQSAIESIGRFMAEDGTRFWSFWTAKSIVTGLVFSRVFPWAKVLTNPNVQLRYGDARDLRAGDN